MNDILFGNNNTKTIKRLSKQYFKKNKVRNLAAILAIVLTAFLFTSITSLAFNMVSSMQLSMQMQKGSKGDGTFGYMTEEQFEQLKNSDFVEQAGHRRTIGYASNALGHSVELNYADSIQQELASVIGQIRRKLTPDTPKGGYIRTVLGSGYKFNSSPF